MKNPNFVSDSIKALTQVLGMAMDYLVSGHAHIVHNDFKEAHRLLSVANTCIDRGIEIHDHLMRHISNRREYQTELETCVAIKEALSVMRLDTQDDLNVIRSFTAMPRVASILN